jgi:hypothetical protein
MAPSFRGVHLVERKDVESSDIIERVLDCGKEFADQAVRAVRAAPYQTRNTGVLGEEPQRRPNADFGGNRNQPADGRRAGYADVNRQSHAVGPDVRNPGNRRLGIETHLCCDVVRKWLLS